MVCMQIRDRIRVRKRIRARVRVMVRFLVILGFWPVLLQNTSSVQHYSYA